MPPFSEEQKALIREIAQEVADAMMNRLAEKLTVHEQTCPHGRRITRMFWVTIGFAAGLGLGGSGLGYLLGRLLV